MDILSGMTNGRRLKRTLFIASVMLMVISSTNAEAESQSKEDSTLPTSLVGATNGPLYRISQEDKPEATVEVVTETATPETTRDTNGDFLVKQGEQVCIRASLKVSIIVKYAARRKNQLSIRKATMQMPDHVAVTGTCAKETASLTLAWASSTYSLTIAFNLQIKERKEPRKKESNYKIYGWGTASASFTFDTRDEAIFTHPLRPGKHTMMTKPEENFFFAPRNRSFSCSSKQRLILNEYNKNGSVVKDDVLDVLLDLDSMHVQAFDIPASGEFSEASLCDSDIYNNLPHQNIVPIIVAACLAGIIMIIIIAYFITKSLGQNPYKAMD